MRAINQISMQEARKLFDYRDGMLFWRQAGSGRRADRAAITQRKGRNGGVKKYVNLGGMQLAAHYAVWNWHHGITANAIVAIDGDLLNVSIENLRETEKVIAPPSRPTTVCPCCNQRVATPTIDIVIDTCKVRPIEAKILRAVWRGNGLPVTTQRIFDAMYEDDPDGGPEPQKMYSAFKVALCHLRKRLIGSGVGIENLGYGRGYRLKIGV